MKKKQEEDLDMEEELELEEEPSEDETNPDKLDDLDLYDDNDLFGEDYLGAGSTPMQKHQDLLKELTNFSPYLKDTVNGWLGVTWDEGKKEYTQNPDIEPLMNIRGAAWCVSALKTYTRPNNIITDISHDDYKNLICDVIDFVWLNIGTRAEEFEVKNEGDILRICNEMEHAAALVLMGAGDGRYNKFLGTVTTHSVNQSILPDRPNQMMNQIPLRNKGGTIQRLKKVLFGV